MYLSCLSLSFYPHLRGLGEEAHSATKYAMSLIRSALAPEGEGKPHCLSQGLNNQVKEKGVDSAEACCVLGPCGVTLWLN